MSSYQNILVLGGHPLSCLYIEKLLQARSEKKISFDSISFIEEKADNQALKRFGNEATWIQKSYADGLCDILSVGAIHELPLPGMPLLIPDHTAPHVLFQVFLKLLEKQGVKAVIQPFTQNLGLPFQKTFNSGICAISFATWTCPVECEEPDVCPAIESERAWDFRKFLSPMTDSFHHFFCEQLVYGVCGIEMKLIREEWEKLLGRINPGLTFLVTTTSKCHGIIGQATISE